MKMYPKTKIAKKSTTIKGSSRLTLTVVTSKPKATFTPLKISVQIKAHIVNTRLTAGLETFLSD